MVRVARVVWVACCWPALVVALHAQAGWTSVDIGAVAEAGSSSDSGGGIVVRGSGADVWDAADEFRFVYRSWSGDGDLVARVAAMDNTDGWAKAGLMFRDGTGAGAANAFLALSPGGAAQFQQRSAAGSTTGAVAARWSAPSWLKLTRRGNVFTAYVSASGTSWEALGSTTIALPASVLVGLAVTSHRDGVLCSASFESVVPPGTPAPLAPAAPSDLAVLARNGFQLSWTDNATNETGFALYRRASVSISDPPPTDPTQFFAMDATIPANSTSYRDAIPGTSGFTTYYAVRAFTPGTVPSDPPVYSDYSNIAGSTAMFAWTNVDVGAVGATGRGSDDRFAYTIAGAGSDIGGTADACRFYGVLASDDLDFRVRVAGVDNTDPQAKAGIMARDNYNDNADTTTIATVSVGLPVFLRLARTGDTFTGYYSGDGTTWTPLGSAYANVSRLADIGLAVSSHRAGTLCEARFDQVLSFGASVYYPPVWPTPHTPVAVVTGLAPGELQVAWDFARGPEIGCEVQRSTDGVNFERRLISANALNQRFIDRGLTAGTRYYYRVRTYNPGGYSAFSAVVSAVTPASVVAPADPSYLTTAPADHAVRLQWFDNASNETGFEVERSTDGVSYVRIATLPAMSSTGGLPTYTDGTAAGGVAYFYRVRAVRDAQVSGYSNVGQATASGAAAGPAAPTALTAVAPAPTRVELGWQDNASDETEIVLERSPGFAPYTTIVTLGANATSYVDSTVAPNTQYYYRVFARNAAGASAYSNLASVRTPELPPTGGVWQGRDVGAVAAAGSDSEAGDAVTVSGSGADIWNGADEFHFRFQPFTGDGEIIARVASLGNTSSWAKAGVMFRETLQAGSRHAFMCVTPGNGTALQRRLATSGESTTSAGSAAAAPRWVRLVRNGSAFLGYESADGAAWALVGSVSLNFGDTVYVGLAVTSHADGVLATATFDHVVVRATGGGTLPAPSELAASASAYDRVNLTWTDNSAGESGFEVEMAPNPSAFSAVGTVGANVTAMSVTALSPESTYYFRVRAFDGAGSSPYSNVVSVTTPPYPPPATLGAPTNLAATATSSSTIDLTWTDNASSELGFEIGLSTDGVTFDWAGKTAANATSTQVAGLQAATTYYFRVRAYQFREGGSSEVHSAPSNLASATTQNTSPPPPSSPPNAPANVAATAVSASQINLTWSDASDNETGFEIETSSDNLTYSLVTTTAAGVTSFAHTGLVPATTYFYRLRAVNAGGHSSYTAPVSATTLADTFRDGDIGAVPVAGDTRNFGTAIALSSTSADIWNAADAFRYRYRSLTGDGTIVARVTGLDRSNGWAKAGLMFRETLAANSRHATMIVSAEHGTALQYRVATGGESGSTAPTEAGGVPRWLRLVRTGDTFAGAQSVDGVTWTPAGSITLALPATIFVGLAVTSHNESTAGTGTFDNVTVTTGSSTPPPPPPDASWSFGDIGVVGRAGANSSSGNTITITGAGADIWGAADAFRFVYRPQTGDGVVEAQVTSMQETNGWAKAGVMIRASLDPGAANVFACATPTFHGLNAQARAASGAATEIAAGPLRNAPTWLRLTRAGSTFTAAASTDGVAWTDFATFTVPMGATAYYGFAVTAHDTTQLNTAVFTDPSVR
jgi:titin